METPKKVNLRALSREDLTTFVAGMGEPAYRARQIFRWLWAKGVSSFGEMTDLPAAFRTKLEAVASADSPEFLHIQQAKDGTLKALVRLASGREVETVLIPGFDEDGDATRLTVCCSSQVGCAMACSFCATGQMGFRQNLTAGEIADQIRLMDLKAREVFGRGITNVVYMGMGEPLLNYRNVLQSIDVLTHEDGLGLSPRRITVSTVGLARRIRDLATDHPRVNLAISLHAPQDEKRSSIMPVNRSEATDLTALREAIQYYTHTTGRKVTYEYCMFAGFNDGDEDARALARVVAWAPSKVNLIMYNPVEGLGFKRTSEAQLNRFIQILVKRNVLVTVRRSRGQDIDAACGQLALKSDPTSTVTE